MAGEPQKILQESPYSDSDERKKLDCFTVFGDEGTNTVVDANTVDNTELESRNSLAWDTAFSSCPGILEPEELLTLLKFGHSQNGFDILGHEQHQLLSAKYLEPGIKSVNDEFNLRKSLAWDSAFFTSEGVLNHEELYLVNKGFQKSETHNKLHGIEELQMSYESNCTIHSDGTSLSSLEVELFEDMKASMHPLVETTNTANSHSKRERNRSRQKINSTKNVDRGGISKLKVKSLPTSVRRTINESQLERIAKESSAPPLRKVASGREVSDPSLLLKPSKMLAGGRNIPRVPTERVSLVSNEVSGELNIVQATKGKCLKFNPGKTCNDNHSCTSSFKSSLACISTVTSPSSETRITNRMNSENCGRPASASSSDSWFLMSSTSTNHESHDSMTSVSDSCRKSCIDADLKVQAHGQSSIAHDNERRIYLPNTCTMVKGNDFVSLDASRNVKPSGLRKPSPKIGFFDVNGAQEPIENGAGKSNRSRSGKFQTAQSLKDFRSAKNSPQQQSRRSLISGTTKTSTSTLGLAKDFSKALSELHLEEKNNVMTSHELEFEVESCARKNKRGTPESTGNGMFKGKAEQACLRGKKRLLQKENIGNEPYMLDQNEKENIIGFLNKLEGLNEQVKNTCYKW